MRPEEVSVLLPAAQTVVTALYESECNSQGIESTDAYCIVDISLESGLRIEPGIKPIIRVSADWLVILAAEKRSGEIDRAIKRAVFVLPRFKRTLSNNATRAAYYVETARTFRLTHPDTFSLPERHFKCNITFTLECPLSGQTETVHDVPMSDLMLEIGEARHRLSLRVFQNEQVAEVLDLVQAARIAREEPEVSTAMEVNTTPNSISMTFEYPEDNNES